MGPGNALLIGNGPSALDTRYGEWIDDFDGIVVRFNAYRIRGYESSVGTRTDWWVGIGNPPVERQDYQHSVFVCQIPDDRPNQILEKFNARFFEFGERIPYSDVQETRKLMDAWWPSTGAIMVVSMILRGYKVYLHGFDFFDETREHHYYKKGDDPGRNHKPDKERPFFLRLLERGEIRRLSDAIPSGGCFRTLGDW